MLTYVRMQDGEVRKAFQRSLTKQGFKFKLNTKVNGAKIESDKVTLDLETKKGDKETFEADVVLVSAGLSLPSMQGLDSLSSRAYRTASQKSYAFSACIKCWTLDAPARCQRSIAEALCFPCSAGVKQDLPVYDLPMHVLDNATPCGL